MADDTLRRTTNVAQTFPPRLRDVTTPYCADDDVIPDKNVRVSGCARAYTFSSSKPFFYEII